MRQVNREKLEKLKPFSGAEIQGIRRQAGLSQAVFAGMLNIATSTLSQWEREEKRPRGAALRLLSVIQQKGLETIL